MAKFPPIIHKFEPAFDIHCISFPSPQNCLFVCSLHLASHLFPSISPSRSFSVSSSFQPLQSFCVSMATPRDAAPYIPSDDGMSDILHTAGHAYAMHLTDPSTTPKDDGLLNDPSLDVSSLRTFQSDSVEIIQSLELAHHNFPSPSSHPAFPTSKYDFHHPVHLHDLQSHHRNVRHRQ